MELLEVREHHVDVVERVRAVRMARDERHLPGREVRVDLLQKLAGLVLQLRDFGVDRDGDGALGGVLGKLPELVDLLLEGLDVVFKFKKKRVLP